MAHALSLQKKSAAQASNYLPNGKRGIVRVGTSLCALH
jgi:hypothetical protein